MGVDQTDWNLFQKKTQCTLTTSQTIWYGKRENFLMNGVYLEEIWFFFCFMGAQESASFDDKGLFENWCALLRSIANRYEILYRNVWKQTVSGLWKPAKSCFCDVLERVNRAFRASLSHTWQIFNAVEMFFLGYFDSAEGAAHLSAEGRARLARFDAILQFGQGDGPSPANGHHHVVSPSGTDSITIKTKFSSCWELMSRYKCWILLFL